MIDIEKTLGNFIKIKRKSKGMNQNQLAILSNVNRVAIANIELGKSKSFFSTYYKLIKALNCDLVDVELAIRSSMSKPKADLFKIGDDFKNE